MSLRTLPACNQTTQAATLIDLFRVPPFYYLFAGTNNGVSGDIC